MAKLCVDIIDVIPFSILSREKYKNTFELSGYTDTIQKLGEVLYTQSFNKYIGLTLITTEALRLLMVCLIFYC